MGRLGSGERGRMPAVERIWTSAPPAGRWGAIIAVSLLVHALLLAVLGSASGVILRQPPAPPIFVDIFPEAPDAWPDFTRRAAAPAAEPRVLDSQPSQTRPDRVPTLRPADPDAVPEARAQGVNPIWRATPDSLAERLANIPPGLIPGAPAGGVPLSWRRRCNLPLEGAIGEADRRACEQSFLAEAEPPPSMRRQRPQGDPRDQFAAQGARNLAEYEARRRPLAGGTGVVGSGECPGGNFGTGCAGSHLDPHLRQGAETTIRQDSNKLD